MALELPASGHEPVLVTEVKTALLPALIDITGHNNPLFVDCTLGRAGHSIVLSHALPPSARLIGLDLDPRNLEFAAQRLRAQAACQTRLFHANFADLPDVLAQVGLKPQTVGSPEGVSALLADLGVSTNQLLDPSYGLSISQDGPLDMRLDPEVGTSAAEIVNRWPEDRIADLLFQNADERASRRIARKIAAERKASPINTTRRLADVVRSAIGTRGDPGGIDPATRTFQALRMEANREVANLKRLLETAPDYLRVGGRMAVISFHSGEDRLVKQAFRDAEASGRFRVVGKKPIAPSEAEIAANPRSRSAKLRVLERCA